MKGDISDVQVANTTINLPGLNKRDARAITALANAAQRNAEAIRAAAVALAARGNQTGIHIGHKGKEHESE